MDAALATPAPVAVATAPSARVRSLSAPLRSAAALPAAAAALVAGAAHVPVIPEHLDEVPYVGRLFVALVAACALGALVLVVRDVAAAYVALAVAGAASVVLFVVSRGPGMPGMPDDVGDWTNQLGLVSVAAESMLTALAVVALTRGLRGRGRSIALAGTVLGAAAAIAASLLAGALTT